MKKPLIVLTGPTAVGKTALSIELAKRVNGEIISADSMQVYKYMDIGTAKIRPEEMDGVKHHLIDCYDPTFPFNVAEFKNEAKRITDDIISRGKIPIICGGTGFYIQALLYDISFEAEEDDGYKASLEEISNTDDGPNKLFEMLKEIDPDSAVAIHCNNTKRVIRALCYYHNTGELMSVHNKTESEKESPYNFIYLVLNMDRAKLYERIEKRIDIMINDGLIDEVKKLMEMGLNETHISMQGLGYKEILSYLKGDITYEEAIYILKRDTRHFAKRQLTWFNREKEVTFVNKDNFNNEDEILRYILTLLSQKSIILSD